MIGNPVYNLLLGTLFEWGVAAHGLETTKYRKGEKSLAEVRKDLRIIGKKVGKQVGKDYIVFPALAGTNWKHTLRANAVANLIRNYWSYMVIFCGHFPDGAEKFTAQEFENESKAEWYLRQMLASANFHAGPVMAFMSGNLCYQIEHHLFPDLPSNRYAEISERVGRCATSTTCPTRRDRWAASTCSRSGPSPSSRCRTSYSKPPPMTPPKRIPNSSSASGPGCGRASASTRHRQTTRPADRDP